MKPDTFTIDVLEFDKVEKISHILDNLGVLVSNKCGCVAYDGKKRCQYGIGQSCKKGYVIIVPRKDRDIMNSVVSSINATG